LTSKGGRGREGGRGDGGEVAQTMYTHMNKCINNINKQIELLTRENFYDLGLGKQFLDLTPNAQYVKRNTEK
jgi:hypothetical protein